MASPRRFSVRDRARSFRPACHGLRLLFEQEHNAWIHGAASLAVAATAWWLACPLVEWAILSLAIGLVWTAEAANSAIERLADCVTTEPNAGIGAAKDLAAGAVLASSVGAAAAGLCVLGPRLWAIAAT